MKFSHNKSFLNQPTNASVDYKRYGVKLEVVSYQNSKTSIVQGRQNKSILIIWLQMIFVDLLHLLLRTPCSS